MGCYMFLPNISESHRSVTSTIQTMNNSEPLVVTVKFSEKIPFSKVIDYTILTRGKFLQIATITKTLHLPG